jgi:hypothetical protein
MTTRHTYDFQLIVQDGFWSAYQGYPASFNPHDRLTAAAARRCWFDGWTSGSIARRHGRRDSRPVHAEQVVEFSGAGA